MRCKYKNILILIILLTNLIIAQINIPIYKELKTREIQKDQEKEDLFDEFPEVSEAWNIDFIHIKNDNWSTPGFPWIRENLGTEDQPHVIENVTIDGMGKERGILIENCSQYFKIRNCTIYNCGKRDSPWYIEGGIHLINTSNGIIEKNNCSYNNISGIKLEGLCQNNTIYNNTINNNRWSGISNGEYFDDFCSYTNITGNIINRNSNGITIFEGTNNTINNNTINFNLDYGIYIEAEIWNHYINYTEISKNEINGNGYGGDIEDYGGLYIKNAYFFNISENTVKNNRGKGMHLITINNSTVNNNSIIDNSEYGIDFRGSNSFVINNTLKDCGIYLYYYNFQSGNSIIDITNTINGKYFYYYNNKNNLKNENFSNAGQIVLNNCNNSMITDFIITNTSDAISLYLCNNVTIENNQLNDNKKRAIEVRGGGNHTIKLNNMTNNEIGIYLGSPFNITLLSNNMTECGVVINGSFEELLEHSIDTSNNVNNKPVYFYVNLTDLIPYNFSNAGQVLLFYCNNSFIRDLDVSWGSLGIIMKNCINITLLNIDSNYNKLDGIEMFTSFYINVTDCSIQKNKIRGIELESCSAINLNNNTINFNEFCGIEFEGIMYTINITKNNISYNRENGIAIDFSFNVNIFENIIKNNTENGIRIDFCNGVQILNNTIAYNSDSGICADDSKNLYINENIIQKNFGIGVELTTDKQMYPTGSYDHIIFNNTISNNRMEGIFTNWCDELVIEQNKINNNENGIILEGCNDTIIEDNFLGNNTFNGITLQVCNYTNIVRNSIINHTNIGIFFTSNRSDDNSIYNNTFINNYIHAIDNGGFNNRWNSSYTGNYWDNYTGSDDNGDGFGETTYYIDGDGEGRDEMPIWDGIKPNIAINLPYEYGSFTDAPLFNVTVKDNVSETVWYHHSIEPIIKIEKMWYTLNSTSPKFFFTSNGTIDPTAWEYQSLGLINITFYVNDSCGNIANSSVLVNNLGIIVPGDDYANIKIISPNDFSKVGKTPPDFIVRIRINNIDTLWYRLDVGLNNITFTNNGTFDLQAWQDLSNGSHLITFFVNSSTGETYNDSVQIYKYKYFANMTIIKPISDNYIFAPNYTIWTNETTISKKWYTFNLGSKKYFFELNGTLNETAWNNLALGEVIIRFYLNNTEGVVDYREVLIYKISGDDSSDGGDGDSKSKDDFDIIEFLMSPEGIVMVGGSIVGIAVISIIKFRGSGKKRLKEIERIDNLRSS